MEEKLSYHVVFTTHNSRTSKRMIKYKVKKGPPLILNYLEELQLTKIIKYIVQKYKIHIDSYNICKDHMHLLLFCTEEKLPKVVRILKSVSSLLLFPNEPLWSQKFFSLDCNTFDFCSSIDMAGFDRNSRHYTNAIAYIQRNRIKHGLFDCLELKEIINSFCAIKRE